jgi:Alpha/beta hydrolase domain
MSDLRVDPIAGTKPPFVGGTGFALSGVGYCEAEYAVSGSAKAFVKRASDLEAVEEADFRTRMLVYRPIESSAFNGTVWIEWLNVSGGLDGAPGWIFTHRELIRSGAAWVGVSAQKVGVEGGASLLGLSLSGLVGTDPERYGGLHHPGDRFSYDIFSLATSLVREKKGTILEGLDVKRIIATGDSQSAFRLTTYVNDVDPVVRVHDGFMVHARGAGASSLGDDTDPSSGVRGDPVFFRSDLRVPVLCVEAETDLINLRYLDARQDDSDMLVVWEMAGTSHADVYTFVGGRSDDGNLSTDELAKLWIPISDLFGMKVDKPINAGPQHYLRNTAASRLESWVRDGARPASSPRLDVIGDTFITDDLGNVTGGIRTPHVDVPTAVLSGLGNSGHAIAFLCGCTTRFDPSRLSSLYSSVQDYSDQFSDATNRAVEAGFILEEDAEEVEGIAVTNFAT